MLHPGTVVRIYVRGVRPDVRYAEVKKVAGDVVTLDEGGTVFNVSRCDIAKQGDSRWWLSL